MKDNAGKIIQEPVIGTLHVKAFMLCSEAAQRGDEV